MFDRTLIKKFEAATDKAFTHYDEAVSLLKEADALVPETAYQAERPKYDNETQAVLLQRAQVHATLFAGLTAAIKTP